MRKQIVASILVLVILLRVDVVCGFSVPIHRAVTIEKLSTITAQVAGQTKTFSQRALDQIANANAATDNTSSAALFHPERHFTNESFADSTTRLVNLKNEIIMNLTSNPPNGTKARELLGTALHTVQDFYSHSNWVELGNAGINTDLGRNIVANPSTTLQTCPTDPDMLGAGGGGGLTSAYFVGLSFNRNEIGCGPLPFPGKCYHGNETTACPGINKDNDVARNDVPPSPFHSQARTAAELATKQYVEDILSVIAGNDKAVSALLDLKGTIGFVIDDTGSMGEEISGVKSVITAIVNVLKLFPLTTPENWLLERFGDPGVGPAFVTDNANALLNAVNGLSASGGGDCPELSQTALLEAIDRAFPNSRLFVFTDASAKDAALTNAVISRAQERSVKINYLLTGSCSPIDQAYVRGAEETGGQLFFINQFEVDKIFNLIEPQLSGNLETILATKGQLSGGIRAFDVPVDSTIQRLVVTVSTNPANPMGLRRPNGNLVSPSDPDARITDLSSGRLITIEAPAAGVWRVELSGSGDFSVVAGGVSPIEFRRFDFVEPNADVIHGGYFPIPGQPLAGANSIGEATILGPFATASFKLVDENGNTIQAINLARNFPDAARDHFLGGFVPPSTPFRVVANGTDSNGLQYQRQFSTVYRAQVVGVKVEGLTSATVTPGTTTAFSFTVTNLGSPATLSINVVNSLGFVTGVNPTLLTLGTGASATANVNVSVPAGTPEGTSFTVTMTATRTDNPTVFNSATLNLVVQGKVFDTCIQDDSNGNKLQFNSPNGDYQFTRCGSNGFTLSGTGTVTIKGSVITLQHNASDRRVTAIIDNSVKRATASIQVFSLGTTFTIADRNTANNTCGCP
jgi:hypothetical protein